MDASGSDDKESQLHQLLFVSILVSIWMHLEVQNLQWLRASHNVSILVSIWMHLEEEKILVTKFPIFCFNPSFYMDASGRMFRISSLGVRWCFNPSFYMDASGSCTCCASKV